MHVQRVYLHVMCVEEETLNSLTAILTLPHSYYLVLVDMGRIGGLDGMLVG